MLLMLDVAVIGLGSEWGANYAPALHSLQKRLRLCAIYSASAREAERAAEQVSSRAATGLRAIFLREKTRGVLLLAATLPLRHLINLACEFGKPMLLAPEVWRWLASQPTFSELCEQTSPLLMPACPWRCTPAMYRLRELVATHLGRPQEIRVQAVPASSAADSLGSAHETDKVQTGPVPQTASGDSPLVVSLPELLDWCCTLSSTAPHTVHVTGNAAAGRQVALEFLPSIAGGESLRAVVAVPLDHPSAIQLPLVVANYSVLCERGTAILSACDTITWQVEGASTTESLRTERTATAVLLDHFSRRIAGGLVPVPRLDDIRTARRLADLAWESVRNGTSQTYLPP